MKAVRQVPFLLLCLFVLGLFAPKAHGQGVGFRESKYVTGLGPEAVAVADLNGDGKLDLAVANHLENSVSILLGNGDGTFGAKTDFATGAGPVGIVVDDFNGDGKLDVATVNNTDSTVSVLLGNGDGTFGTKSDFATGTDPAGITSGDFNGDGKPDLVTANAGGNDISILLGQGGGALASKVNFPTSTRPIRVVAGDFNGDGKLDVAALAYQSNVVSLLLGNGDGTFQAKTDAATGSTPWSLAKSDFDGDAKLDLVTANLNDWTASILRGKGDGTFDPKTDLGTDTGPIAVTAADFNADGKMDFLTANPGYSYGYYGYTYFQNARATLRLGNGDGTFGGVFAFALASDPNAMAIGDFNADGRIDVAIANQTDNSVTILLQSAAVGVTPCCGLSFGWVAAGSSSPNQDVILDSTGSFPVSVSSVALSGADASQFNISADTCSSATVNPLSHCTVSVVFAPTSAGSKAASVTITHNAPSSPTTVSLNGNGLSVTPLAVLAPSSLDFGTVFVGQTASSTVTLGNSSTVTLNITSITLTGANAAEFQLTNHCGATLASTASCNIDVEFKPTSAGAKSAALSVASNATGSPNAVPLTGTAVMPPAVSLAPGSLTFNTQLVGTPSSSQGVTLTNTGGSTLTISSITLGGTNAADFSLTNNCGATLAVGANCGFSVVFTPTSAGAKSASVNIDSDAPSSPNSVALGGTGVTPPAVSLAPTSLTFSAQVTGTSSTAQSVTLTNSGGSTLTISSIGLLPSANMGVFRLTNNCGASLAPAATCTLSVDFAPINAGAVSGVISIDTNAASSPDKVSLSGTGITPAAVSLAPASLTFSAQTVGTTSAAQTVTLTNTGGGTLTITSMSVSGANAGDFTRSDNCGTSVNGGASCVITVTFKPTAAAGRAASVSIVSNASGSPQTVVLSGTGTDFSVAPASGSSTSVTVSRGGSTSITLSFSPVSGFTGNVALSCSTSSAEVGCSVPTSVNISGPTPTNVTVNVLATTRAMVPPLRVPPTALSGFDARMALAWMLMLVMMGAMLRRAMGRRARTAAALVAIFLCAQLWTGCGGASGPPAPRTYSVTVSASSAGAAHTIGLTVNVP